MNTNNQITNFLKYLTLRGVSQKSLKYYKSDLNNFLSWAGDRKVDNRLVHEYINTSKLTTPLSTLNRRLSTLRSYSDFVGRDFMSGIENQTSVRKVVKTWQDAIISKFETKPKIKNLLHKLFFNRPNWYRQYHSYPLASYIHIAILILFTSISGYAFYDQVFYSADRSLAFPSALTRPNRYLSFQGRLTDNLGNPKTVATSMVFKLYSVSTGGSALWDSGTCTITPDQDGIFSTLLGSSCGAEIPATVFSENAAVWLGATMGLDAEATPRVQIATVAYALNAETLQGFPAGTGTSTIPYINSAGNVVLANASPKIQSTSGTFAVEGLAMSITTPNASDGVITIAPDGVGTVDLTFEGAAPGLSQNGFVNATNANITSGSLYSGTVASNATGYYFINFLSGSPSSTSKFSVDASGNVIMAGDLTISGGNINTGNIAFTIGDVTTDSITFLTDGTGNGEIVLPNDSIGPNEVSSAGQSDEYCLTYEGTGTAFEWQSCTAAGSGTWSGITAPTGNQTLDMAGYTTTFGWTSTGDLNAWTNNFNNNSTSATTQNAMVLNNAAVGSFTDTATENLILLQQLDTTAAGTTVLTNALKIDSAANSGITNGINITNSAGDITTGINIADTAGGTLTTGIALSGTFTTGIDAGNSIIVNIGNAGTDFTSAGGLTLAGVLTVNNDANIVLPDASTVNINGDGTPTSDLLLLGNSDTSVTSGVDGVTVNLSFSNASGDSIHVVPTFAGGATDTLTYNIFEADAFSPSNSSGVDFVNGIKLGNLTDPGGTINSAALRIGTGWDAIFSGTTAGTNILSFTNAVLSSGGNLSVTGVLQAGGTTAAAYSRLGTATADHTGNITTTSDLLVSSDVEIDGTLFMDSGSIAATDGTVAIQLSGTPVTVAHTLSGSSWLVDNTANTSQAAFMVNNQTATDLITAGASSVTKFTLANTGTITTANGSYVSSVTDSSTAVGFTLNTANALSTQGAKLLSLKNSGTEKMYLDANGNLYVSGTVVTGNGTSMLLTNKSGGIVANRSIVVLDSTNNTSFTTTTTPYSKAGFGVVVGVGLGVTNDADGDGVCDADDICMVAYGGSVNVTVKNATTAAKGEYLFTSDTAGSAVASAKQYDGLVGVVTDVTNAASGYLKMIFKVQPQVTAAAAIDKASKHNEYWLYADQYNAVNTGSDLDENLLNRGLVFDTFKDTTKTDSANTSASIANDRIGLIGGQTLNTATNDNDGQAYLGSNTVNDIYYYDRTKDSVPAVLVELGIDPNWYNGVTLSVATGSATYSQNGTIDDKNPNLTTSYNGSLIKATGTDTTPRTIFITIKSPTTFDWTNYQGDAGTGVTITPGVAQTLGDTGVSATFTATSYNVGDVFKIASWYIEPESATRGAKQQFPERSNVIATASSVDIIDSDTQKLWMRFNGVAWSGFQVLSSVSALNGKIYGGNSTAQGLGWANFDKDAYGRYIGSSNYQFSIISTRNTAGTGLGQQIGATGIVNDVVNDVAAAVIPNQPTQEVTVSGWGYLATSSTSETVNLPYRFNSNPNVLVSWSGDSGTTAPASLSNCSNASSTGQTFQALSVNTNSFISSVAGGSATKYLCYTWTATGSVSPKQFVAVATGATNTDGGTTIINETDGTKADVQVGSQTVGTLWQNKVAIAGNTLYNDLSYQDGNLTYLTNYRGIHGLQSETSWAQYRNEVWGVNGSGGNTPQILGTSTTLQIKSLSATENTSTMSPKSNTIYVGTGSGVSVIQDVQNSGNVTDGYSAYAGSVKYYTKDYISEEMVGDVRGMWPLSANGALSMSDASVKADTLTNNNTVTAVTGVRGAGASFNGTNQYLSCTDANCGGTSKTDLTTSGSFGAWINKSALGTLKMIMSKDDAVSSRAYNLYVNSSNKIILEAYTSVPASAAITSNTAINANNWYHVVGTYDGSNVKLYINGQLDVTGTLTGTFNDSTAAFMIGQRGDLNASYYFNGSIDEPFVTATALTAGQVKNMYQVGYRALQSHGTTLGGGAADTNQQLGYISTGTSSVGVVAPDFNNQYMYVGTNSTSLGALSKIQLNSDTNVKTYNSSANVPAGGTLLIDEDVTSLGVGYTLDTVGSAASGVKTMGVDDNSTATSGNFVSKTMTTAESFNQAYLWAQYVTDSSDISNTIQVWASNDGGSNYYQCNLNLTDSSRTPAEYEYFCQFNNPGSSLKTKFVMARGSTKTNTYVTRYGISWIDSSTVVGSSTGIGNGLYTNTNTAVADGAYLTVTHNQNTNDLLSSAWVYAQSLWKSLDATYKPAISWEGKDTTRGVYHNEVNLYQASEETNAYTENLVQNGLLFDTFEDGTKTDSANTTDSIAYQMGDDGSANYVTLNDRVQGGRTGLIGGQTLNTATNDNDGQAYLGSNTVNDIYYYDRTKDSVPAVLVELGIDPNWYNGVTLSVATSSASYSQNGTIAEKNPNLTTSYNGSLIKATGTDTTPRTIFITIKSPTTFDWTNYQGDSATGVTITPGTAQTLTGTGVSVTFSAATYNVGDVFKIASWYIEAEGTTRGARQQFPERANVIAEGPTGTGYVDIIDADTQKLWMRFTGANNNMIYVDANNKPNTTSALNGKIYVGTLGTSGFLQTVDFATDFGNLIDNAAAEHQKYKDGISTRNSGLSYAAVGFLSLVNRQINDISAAVIPNQPTQEVTVSGWGYIQGAAATGIAETVNLPYKFNSVPNISMNYAGDTSSVPTSLGSCDGSTKFAIAHGDTPRTSTFRGVIDTTDATNFSTTQYYCYTWTATGIVSPKQFVAVGTGGGISLINETDQTVASGTDTTASFNNACKIQLTNNDRLYAVATNGTCGVSTTRLWPIRDVAGKSSLSGTYYSLYHDYSPAATAIPSTNSDVMTNLSVTQGTSTVDGIGNTIYVGGTTGLSVIQEKYGNMNVVSGKQSTEENLSSVKYYAKDYISEEMIGDIRGMWPLNNANSSSDFEDVSIKANTLTGTNITANGDSVSGVRGTATDFNGTDEYMSCTDAACGGTIKLDANGSSTTGWSVGAWIKPTSVSVKQMILSKLGNAGQYGYVLYVNPSANPVFTVSNNGSSITDFVTSATISSGQWTHLASVYDGSSVKIYINGQLSLSTAYSSGIFDNTAPFCIGCDFEGASTTAANFFNGSIDEPFVTATALTAGQVKNMYQVGYRALQSHGTTLGGGAADTNQQLGGASNNIGAVLPDFNNQYMYVGSNHTTDGALSKIQLNSDTNVKTYDTGANVPAGGTIIVDDDINSLGVGYTLDAVGSAASGVKTMGVDDNSTATSGNFVSKTYALPKNIGSAVLWVSPILDSSDGSNTLVVKASNDGGSNYATCTLASTDTRPAVSEREYACTFTASDNDLKVKFEFARGSTKTNTYVTQYGISWLGQTGFRIEQADANNVRLYNYTGETQNLRLDVVTGQFDRNAGTLSLAPIAADTDTQSGVNSLWINKTGTGGNLVKLQTNGTDVLTLNSTGTLTLAGDFLPSANDTYNLGSTTARWKDVFLGGETMHIGTSLTDEATLGYDTTNNILNFGTDSTTNGDIAFFTDDLYLDKSVGFVGIGTTSPQGVLHLSKTSAGIGERLEWNATNNVNTLDFTMSNGNGVMPNANSAYLSYTTNNADFGIRTTTSGAANFLINSSGNVGIGTTAPGVKLDIKNSAADGGTPSVSLRLTNDVAGATSRPAMSFYNTAGNMTSARISSEVGSSYNASKLFFETADSSQTLQYRMTIDSGGNVGIGTTSPSNKLEVKSSTGQAANVTTAAIVGSGGTNMHGILGQATNYWGGVFYNTNSTTEVDLAGPTYSAIFSNGNVGIGTGSPGEKLSVAGNISTTGGDALKVNSTWRALSYQSGGAGSNWVHINPYGDASDGVFINTNCSTCTTRLHGTLSTGGVVAVGVAGDLTLSRSATNTGAMYLGNSTNNGYVYYAGDSAWIQSNRTFTPASDRRIKSEVEDISYGLEDLMKLDVKKYNFHNTAINGDAFEVLPDSRPALGLIAQDVYNVIPTAVFKPADENKTLWGIDYNGLFSVAVRSIQELNTKVEGLALNEIGDVTLNGSSVDDYAVTTSEGTTSKVGAFASAVVAKLKAGIGSFNEVETKMISPVANADLIIDLQPDNSQEASKLAIKGENDEIVASIDAAGKITSKDIEVESNATISGTLYADNIESERLDQIESLLAEVEGNQTLFAESQNWNIDTATESAEITDVIANNLFVTGNASVTSLFVTDNLTAKSLDSIEGKLSIQSLAIAPLEIMAGKIVIDTNGDAKFFGNVEVAGNLKLDGNIVIANNIDPVATESATIVEGQVSSNATAGKATLTAGLSELKIINRNVKTNSLIYVTPVSSTQNKVLYVKSKDVNEFTIGFNEAIDTDVEFNWWIIELQDINTVNE